MSKQAMTFRLFPDVAEYLQTLEKGEKTKAVEDALRRSQGFRHWNWMKAMEAENVGVKKTGGAKDSNLDKRSSSNRRGKKGRR